MSITPKMVADKNYVDVEATVKAVKEALQEKKEVEFVSKQTEISRAGMVIKRVEEETKCLIKSMKTENKVEKYLDRQSRERERKVLYFKAVFVKQ